VPLTRPRAVLAVLVLGLAARAAELPAWWRSFPGLPRLESGFAQESESAVFGKLVRQGRLKLAQGGRLRVEYRKGGLLVADGADLVQYDPDARTAQRFKLRTAAGDAPLLYVLLNPGGLGGYYEAKPGAADQSVVLEPRRPGLPRVELTGKGSLLQRIQWIDATGARQVIELQDPKVPKAFPAGTFTFQAPAGTRWLSVR
jgi:outer membrane lipoprotein-sorting protein